MPAPVSAEFRYSIKNLRLSRPPWKMDYKGLFPELLITIASKDWQMGDRQIPFAGKLVTLDLDATRRAKVCMGAKRNTRDPHHLFPFTSPILSAHNTLNIPKDSPFEWEFTRKYFQFLLTEQRPALLNHSQMSFRNEKKKILTHSLCVEAWDDEKKILRWYNVEIFFLALKTKGGFSSKKMLFI